MRERSCRLLLWSFAIFCPGLGYAQSGSLRTIPVPSIPGLERYVQDQRTLVVLGKCLFWDMQVGSDGRTACATCHFHAGADHRSQNQLSDTHADFPINERLTADHFPFRTFTDSGDNRSPVMRDSSQRAGSAGVVLRTFLGLGAGSSEQGLDLPGLFHIGNTNSRQVTLRNTPSVINAVFNVRNFRDGRASEVFTGRTPFGDSDPNPNLVTISNGVLVPEFVRLQNASLASLAVGPPVNTTEMSYEGRTWDDIAKKLLRSRPLALQHVALDDSVLAPYASPQGPGLAPQWSYLTLIQSAFRAQYWNLDAAQVNFSFFFGVAVQAYLSTLVSDDSRIDQFAEGRSDALSTDEISGLLVFQGSGMCMFCHNGPETTSASFTFSASHGSIDSVLTGTAGPLRLLHADSGFFDTGVRPAAEDAGLDGADTFGVPYSLAVRSSASNPAVTGAFKVPGLRNIEFTGPYFHNGGQATLDQVVAFYSRGGDFPDSEGLPVEIARLSLDAGERAQLVAFLKAFSDDRVRFERSPFDHPELCVPVGYSGGQERWAGIPAVGRNGNAVPLQTFEELLDGIGEDGSRAHTLVDACGIE